MSSARRLQVILAPKDGGLVFCSTAETHEAAFPWTASHVACSAVTGSAIAVVTKPGRGEEPWLHILDGNVQAYDTPCDPAQLAPLPAIADTVLPGRTPTSRAAAGHSRCHWLFRCSGHVHAAPLLDPSAAVAACTQFVLSQPCSWGDDVAGCAFVRNG